MAKHAKYPHEWVKDNLTGLVFCLVIIFVAAYVVTLYGQLIDLTPTENVTIAFQNRVDDKVEGLGMSGMTHIVVIAFIGLLVFLGNIIIVD